MVWEILAVTLYSTHGSWMAGPRRYRSGFCTGVYSQWRNQQVAHPPRRLDVSTGPTEPDVISFSKDYAYEQKIFHQGWRHRARFIWPNDFNADFSPPHTG